MPRLEQEGVQRLLDGSMSSAEIPTPEYPNSAHFITTRAGEIYIGLGNVTADELRVHDGLETGIFDEGDIVGFRTEESGVIVVLGDSPDSPNRQATIESLRHIVSPETDIFSASF